MFLYKLYFNKFSPWIFKLFVLYYIFIFYTEVHAIDKKFSAITFNIENLFDDKTQGTEYPQFQPPVWGTKEYQKKLVAVGSALQKIARSIDIIALQEIENKIVLEDLQKYYLPQFIHLAISDDSNSAVEVALLSKKKILSVKTHDISVTGVSKSLRPILDVNIEVPGLSGKILQVLIVHLKSRRFTSGKFTSDEIRNFQYALLSQIIDKKIPTLILGDFNDNNPTDNIKKNILFSPKIVLQSDTTYSHDDGDQKVKTTGTYYYRSAWIELDHILYDKNAHAVFSKSINTILAIKPFINDKGLPNKSTRRSIGVSDHLPLLFETYICRQKCNN